MNIARRHIGAVLGIFGGLLGVLDATAPSLHNSFLGYFTANVVCGLAVMISCSAIIGAVLALKGKPILGGYLMLLGSLIWAISPLLIFLMSIIWAFTLSGIMGTMNGILLTLYFLAGPGAILSLIGGALVLSAKNKAFLIYISAFILTLDVIATGIFWYIVAYGLFILILNLTATGVMWYLAVTS